MQSVEAQADQAAVWLHERWPVYPRHGIVLGTGASQVAKAIQVEKSFPYEQIPNFPRSTATGHAGQLLCGRLAGRPVIAMSGRFHLYEGYPVDRATMGIHVMQRLGVRFLMVSNAAGGVNPRMGQGEVMAITSHIDFMYRATFAMQGPVEWGRPAIRSDRAYDPELIEQAQACARRHDFPLHRGVYVGMLGPNYETRAEYRMLRRIGGDTVGMSTVPEVAVASRYGLRVLAISIVTNVANPDVLEKTSGEEVVSAGDLASPLLKLLFENAVQQNA